LSDERQTEVRRPSTASAAAVGDSLLAGSASGLQAAAFLTTSGSDDSDDDEDTMTESSDDDDNVNNNHELTRLLGSRRRPIPTLSQLRGTGYSARLSQQDLWSRPPVFSRRNTPSRRRY